MLSTKLMDRSNGSSSVLFESQIALQITLVVAIH